MDYIKLDVWIQSRKLVSVLYEDTKNFPSHENYGLTQQMRRAAISVPSNIAEGCGRQTTTDTIHFLHIARGSLYELEAQYYLALDQKYLEESQFLIVKEQIETCKKLINGFINYYRKLK